MIDLLDAIRVSGSYAKIDPSDDKPQGTLIDAANPNSTQFTVNPNGIFVPDIHNQGLVWGSPLSWHHDRKEQEWDCKCPDCEVEFKIFGKYKQQRCDPCWVIYQAEEEKKKKYVDFYADETSRINELCALIAGENLEDDAERDALIGNITKVIDELGQVKKLLEKKHKLKAFL